MVIENTNGSNTSHAHVWKCCVISQGARAASWKGDREPCSECREGYSMSWPRSRKAWAGKALKRREREEGGEEKINEEQRETEDGRERCSIKTLLK